MTIRGQILGEAQAVTDGDRAVSYGDPVKNLSDIAALFTVYLRAVNDAFAASNSAITSKDVAVLMTLVKIARTCGAAHVADNYIDGAAYLAIACECVERQEK